jgi:hypothetical protein
MNRTAFLLASALGFSALASTGCYATVAYAPSGAPMGFIYNGTQSSKAVTANPVGSKHGEACGMSILGLVTIGDSSAATAAKSGGITHIGVVDNDDMNILGIYASHCTEVTGD